MEPIESSLRLFAVSTDTIPHCRGAVGLGCLPGVECFEDIFGVDERGPCWVHVRDDSGDLHGEVEEREEWKAGDIDFTGLDVVVVAEEVHLSIEHLMFVDDAFWWTGAAAREDNRGGIGRHCEGEWSGELAAGIDELFIGDAAEAESFGCDDDVEFCISVTPRHEFSEGMDWGDGDETMGVNFIEAAKDAGFSHAGIDEYADGAGAEDGEGEGDEFDGGADHEREAVSGLDAKLNECSCSCIDIAVELQEGAAGPCGAVSVVAGKRSGDGGLVWNGEGGVAEAVGDVERRGHSWLFFVGQAEAAGVRLGWCGFAGLSRLENAAIEIGSFCRIAQ